MDINKVKVLIYAVDNGSLLTTAAKLGYTQAGLTHLMNSLESELGVVLLHRGKFGVRLTEEGERLMPLFKELVKASGKIETEVDLILKQKASMIRIAAVASVIRTWLPDVMRAFQLENPEISFEIKEGDDRLYEWFDEGQVDMCITTNLVKRDDFVPLARDDFFAVLPPEYPWREGEPFPLHKIETEHFLFPYCASDLDVEQQLAGYRVKPNKQTTYVDDNSAISMVAKGFGISLMPDLVLQTCRDQIKIAPLDLPCYRNIGMIYKSGKNASAAVKKFASFLKKWNF